MHTTEAIVAINIAPNIDPTSGEGGRAPLASALLAGGAEPIITKSDGYDTEAGTVDAWRITEVRDTLEVANPKRKLSTEALNPGFGVEPVTVSLDAIGAIRNTHRPLGFHPGELNAQTVRSRLRDRENVLMLALVAGSTRFFQTLQATEPLSYHDRAMFEQSDNQVHLRPRLGLQAGTRPIQPKTLTIDQVPRLLESGELAGIAEDDQWVVEATSAQTIAVAQLPETMRHGNLLRVINFGANAESLITSAVMRERDGSEVVWRALHPSQVPDGVLQANDMIYDLMRDLTREQEMHIAVDFVPGGVSKPGLVIDSIVGAEPNLAVGDNALRRQLAGLLAEQLIRVAKAHGTK